MINSGKVTCGSSLNILTWQQLNGTENYSNMMPAVKNYFFEKGELYDNKKSIHYLTNNNISYYDLHDGKILYLLTQHSLWNRKHHPFLWCTCMRGEGVKNANHTCELISDQDYLAHYLRSERRCNLKHKTNDGHKSVYKEETF